MARRKASEPVEFDPYAHLDKELDNMEKKFKLNAFSMSKDEPRFSTSILSLDCLLAGGLLGGGWYTCFGGEQSCKSTLAMTLLASIVSQKSFVGRSAYFDYEGSAVGDYVENILEARGVTGGVDKVFGIRDDESGEWVVQPRVRYFSPDVGEKFFNWLAKLEKILPDKLKIGKEWYYVYPNTRENMKALKGLYDKEYFSRHNALRIPAADGSIQAIAIVDSYPSMLPSAADEKEEGDKSLAGQARMFSEGLKRIKGLMRSKRIVVLGVNQLRAVPMAMYGPTEQEPGGNALKFYSDVRLRTSSVSPPHKVVPKGPIEKEDSVISDGEDTYRYIKIKTYKNKLGGIPNQEIIQRIVVENGEGKATGFCRTWDAYQYLKMTGQVSGTRKSIKFNEFLEYEEVDRSTGEILEHSIDFKSPLAGCKLDWYQFKTLIEGDRQDIRHVCEELGLSKPIIFLNFLKRQVAQGKGYEYVKVAKRAEAMTKKSRRAAAVSDDDDEE